MKPKFWRKCVGCLLKTYTNIGSDVSNLIVSYVTYSKYNEKLYRGIIPKEIPYSAIECEWSNVSSVMRCKVPFRWSFRPARKGLRIANCCHDKHPILCVKFFCDVCNKNHNGWCESNRIILDGGVYLTIITRTMWGLNTFFTFEVAIL